MSISCERFNSELTTQVQDLLTGALEIPLSNLEQLEKSLKCQKEEMLNIYKNQIHEAEKSCRTLLNKSAILPRENLRAIEIADIKNLFNIYGEIGSDHQTLLNLKYQFHEFLCMPAILTKILMRLDSLPTEFNHEGRMHNIFKVLMLVKQDEIIENPEVYSNLHKFLELMILPQCNEIQTLLKDKEHLIRLKQIQEELNKLQEELNQLAPSWDSTNQKTFLSMLSEIGLQGVFDTYDKLGLNKFHSFLCIGRNILNVSEENILSSYHTLEYIVGQLPDEIVLSSFFQNLNIPATYLIRICKFSPDLMTDFFQHQEIQSKGDQTMVWHTNLDHVMQEFEIQSAEIVQNVGKRTKPALPSLKTNTYVQEESDAEDPNGMPLLLPYNESDTTAPSLSVPPPLKSSPDDDGDRVEDADAAMNPNDTHHNALPPLLGDAWSEWNTQDE